MNAQGNCGTYTPWNITQPLKWIWLLKCALLTEKVRAYAGPCSFVRNYAGFLQATYYYFFLMQLLTRDSNMLMACRLELSQRWDFLMVHQQVCSWAALGSFHRGPRILRAAFLLLASRALTSPFAWEDSYSKYKSPWLSTAKSGIGHLYYTYVEC